MAKPRPMIEVTHRCRPHEMIKCTDGIHSFADWLFREAARLRAGGAKTAIRHFAGGVISLWRSQDAAWRAERRAIADRAAAAEAARVKARSQEDTDG